jgi:FAD/FMN-containing dehydrogenase/Fe-S oxidoreductase
MTNPAILAKFAIELDGELHFDTVMRTLYATDASAYREMPTAVAIPKTIDDIKKLIHFARENGSSIIPRTAGTSLAGQVVGNGIVVDVSKNFTKILEVNKEEHWVRVQPGVVRDVLNMELKKHGLFFGPETSTANRAMIGGMVGNNSCGSNSVVYGSTREHLLEVKALLSDGSEVTIGSTPTHEEESAFLSSIYTGMNAILSDSFNQTEIRKEFPKPTIERRNTGYALDMLLNCEPFTEGGKPFNLCEVIAGSEGTLCFLTEIKLHVNDLPPTEIGLVCGHFNTVDEALRANLIGLKYKPSASELMDHYILECTKANKEHSQNRFFVQGDPGAILVVELRGDTHEEIARKATEMEAEMRAAGLGYHFPVVYGADTKRVWDLRKAGLGLLSNLPGDEKAVAVIEDTAVDVNDLPDFIRDFNEILTANNLYCVHYAHAGSGEIHLRPIINLKTVEGNKQFRLIAEEIATLVKKYKGSLSGEHGDGRLRGEFIKQMVGKHNYQLMKDVKRIWDPNNIFNPNKVVDTPPMDTFLRYTPGQQTPEIKTTFRFTDQNILQHTEQCNGSGDCRKTHLSGGTMCPSYMATRNEKETTRARANILREFLTNSDKANRFDHEEIKEVFDLCLACKGCKSDCPSNVDVAKLKMEFLHQYYKENGVPIRSRLVGNFANISKIVSHIPWAYNFVYETPFLRRIANTVVGFHPDRTMPLLSKSTFMKSYKHLAMSNEQQAMSIYKKSVDDQIQSSKLKAQSYKKVFLFVDEFTNYNDVEIGITAVKLLNRLGYEVIVPNHVESGRPQLSKGLLDDAKRLANQNVSLLKDVVSEEIPLIGIEPSAILTFRDEYPDLVDENLMEDAKTLSKNVFMIEEFLSNEIEAKRISKSAFTTEKRLVKLHGHCQQKSLSSMVPAKRVLSLPENYEVQLIPSGCCGMAGSFGYEKEHFELSNQIGELVLFPTIRQQGEDVIIAASGTSCRHQIHDGTGRTAKHAVEILFEALV